MIFFFLSFLTWNGFSKSEGICVPVLSTKSEQQPYQIFMIAYQDGEGIYIIYMYDISLDLAPVAPVVGWLTDADNTP